jgi:spoIIIJ-associated protein
MSNGEHSPEEVAEDATAFVAGLLDAFGLDGTVAASQPADGEIEIAVEGEGLGLLVGPKGQTLLAIQDLTRLVAQRHVGPGSPRLGVDVGGYRQRRVEALRRFSLQVAEQVVETGLPKSLEPMAAADRKVVHDALTDVVGVGTLSEGEEPYRRVVIVPEAVGG